MDTKLHEAAERLVRMHVHYCVSSLVYGLTGADLSVEQCQTLGIDGDELIDAWRRPVSVDDYREALPADYQVRQDGDSWKWKAGEGMWSPPFDDEREALSDALADAGKDEPDGAEVYEHWIVNDWLADRLEEKGERVLRDFAGLTIWARPTTGQAISIDGVIEDIAAEHFLAA